MALVLGFGLVAGLVASGSLPHFKQALWDGGRRRVLCVGETEVGKQPVPRDTCPRSLARVFELKPTSHGRETSPTGAAPMRQVLTTKDLNELHALSC